MNIIDTISAGFETVRRNPWLLLLPVLLDLFLWFGPKLSIAPIVDDAITAVEDMQAALAAERGLDTATTGLPELDLLLLRETAGRANLLSGIAWGVLGVPSVTSTRLIEPTDGLVVELSDSCSALGIVTLVFVTGLFVATFYLALAGRVVRGDQESVRETLRRLPRYAFSIIVILLPIVLTTAMAAGLSIICGPFTFLFLGVALWLGLYLYFAPEAITMSHAKPLEAARNSIIVLRTAFWPTLGFIVLCTVIAAGVNIIWQSLLTSSLGTLVAIPVNAFIGTGLTVAAFIYYRERLSLWHGLIAQAHSRRRTEGSLGDD